MLTIDGSVGEGGGQILRTALALALHERRAFRIVNIRARRPRPGLRPQHLAAVRAAAEVSSAAVEGAAIGARTLTFVPGPVAAGRYRFVVGTAGSASLVLQTVLPALLTADRPSELELEGGTHNPRAPTEVFAAFGRRGVPAERVASAAAAAARRYIDADVPVGPHLADQLLLPLALAGAGSFTTLAPTEHTSTNIRVIREFLPLDIRCAEVAGSRKWQVSVAARD